MKYEKCYKTSKNVGKVKAKNAQVLKYELRENLRSK